MQTQKYLHFLHKEIHSTVFATVDEYGLPHTCVIDIMLCDEGGLYFLTAKGKDFYNRLKNQHYISLSGMKGTDTLSSTVVSIRGKVRELGNQLVTRVFQENPYMQEIYPKQQSRQILTIFQIYQGTGEYFDLTKRPPFKQAFSFGGAKTTSKGYHIGDNCTNCGNCLKNCPSDCIEQKPHYKIRTENCIHCGNCFAACQFGAVEKLHPTAI